MKSPFKPKSTHPEIAIGTKFVVVPHAKLKPNKDFPIGSVVTYVGPNAVDPTKPYFQREDGVIESAYWSRMAPVPTGFPNKDAYIQAMAKTLAQYAASAEQHPTRQFSNCHLCTVTAGRQVTIQPSSCAACPWVQMTGQTCLGKTFTRDEAMVRLAQWIEAYRKNTGATAAASGTKQAAPKPQPKFPKVYDPATAKAGEVYLKLNQQSSTEVRVVLVDHRGCMVSSGNVIRFTTSGMDRCSSINRTAAATAGLPLTDDTSKAKLA
jgi:hypothetical protein